jgi:hypothetical protein
MRLRGPYSLACVALVMLIGLAALEAAEASNRILWRFTVLSWDNPATQVSDELVCESSPPSEAGAEAGQSTRLSVAASGRLPADSLAASHESPALSSGITRSPPAA